MKEYDIFVPRQFPDGGRIPESALDALKKRLVGRFGGVTHFPQANEGLWKLGRTVFRDEITILRVLSDGLDVDREFFRALKKEMERELQQEEVLIIARDVALL